MNYIFFIVFLYIFFGFLLYIFQRRIIFNTSGKPNSPEYYNLGDTKEIFIKTTDKISLLGWFYQGHENKPILVYFHGNSFDIGERAYRIKRYNDAGFSTLIVAWRGFSGNEGNPTEKSLYLDGKATIDWVLNNTKFSIKDIINYGESLGSGVAVELNLKYNFLCTVLETPFTSIANAIVGVLSAIVDNIPVMFAVITMRPEMSTDQWLLVTLTTGVGGSLLSIGSAAGVALMGQARGYYTFFGHLKWTPIIFLGYVASIYVHVVMSGLPW